MIAITVNDNKENSQIQECFGKSDYFYIIDKTKNEKYFLQNTAKNLPKNSGKKAAMILINKGVKTVISSNFGTNVKKIFDKHKIQIVILSNKFKTLKDLKDFKYIK